MSMNIFNIAFCITAAFYMYIISRFLNAFLGKRNYNLIIIMAQYLLFYAATIAGFFIFNNPLLNLGLSLTFILVLTINYKSDWKHKLFYGLLTYILLFACEEIVYIATQKMNLYVVLKNPEIRWIFILVVSRVLAFIISLIFTSRKKSIKYQSLPLINWIAILSIPLLTTYFAGVILFHYEVFEDTTVIFSIIALVIINIIAFNLYDLLCNYFTNHFSKVMMENQMDFYKKQLDLIYSSQESSKALLHDMKNHLTVIGEFLRTKDIESARSYLLDINKEMAANSTKIITGNIEIDSILSYKSNQALKENIHINIKSSIPRKLNISPFDLNIVLGNLIDNAIEATLKANSKADINLSIKLQKGIVYIKSRNYYIKDPKILDGEIVTSKKDKSSHGYGLRSVKSTVKKYNGDISLDYQNNIFEAVVLLYNE